MKFETQTINGSITERFTHLDGFRITETTEILGSSPRNEETERVAAPETVQQIEARAKQAGAKRIYYRVELGLGPSGLNGRQARELVNRAFPECGRFGAVAW
jgi:hypothetical protein